MQIIFPYYYYYYYCYQPTQFKLISRDLYVRWSANSRKLIIVFETTCPKRISTYQLTGLLGFLRKSCFLQLHPKRNQTSVTGWRPPPVCSRSRVPLKPFQREPYSSYFSQKPKQFFSPWNCVLPSNQFLSAIKVRGTTGNRVSTFEKPNVGISTVYQIYYNTSVREEWTHDFLPHLFITRIKIIVIVRKMESFKFN